MNSSASCLFPIADQAFSVWKIVAKMPGERVELNAPQELWFSNQFADTLIAFSGF